MPLLAHMTLSGQTQGQIKGDCQMKGREDSIEVQAFNHEIRTPRDPQSGLPTGKRIHNALSIVKVIDKSSPLLYRALVTGEQMKEVVIKWYRQNPQGKEEHYFTHKLENAMIVSMRPWKVNCLDDKTLHYKDMEELSFTYRKITWTFEDGGVSAQDDWFEPSA